ncbi:TIGR03620 family F420-dependent LLM class oxidoreductase [Catenulispora sp. NL8]|uniref:TIGR03620 family F420-dependent LLM class oxidoreductase n=1 Tax=Catenulispora pinistramenti TaxID=2705254 RepID=A0ABS5KP16_9ACTN|nr:TIGR03620 family F420-dependent LLM class oxidoreductase [Catenulispora pinistramenti]MBS2547772.1 TIGR03620 family F420-dependent LLM class oxidoreductase [Catenulispora pinistramenti]
MTVDLGRMGLWAPWALWDAHGAGLADAAAELDGLGFGTLWIGNEPGLFAAAESMLAATSRIAVATGIANIWVHPAAVAAAAAAQAAVSHPNRLLLGVGNGPREAAQWWLSPYARMIAYFDELDRLGTPASARILAAVGPKMLALAAERSAGAHPFLTTAEHTRQARQALGPGPLLTPELKVVLEPAPERARATARGALGFYLDKRGFSTNLRRLGFTDADLGGGGSDRLVDAVVACGDADRVLRRIAEFRDADADHAALQVTTDGTNHPEVGRRRLPTAEYRVLAEALGPVPS